MLHSFTWWRHQMEKFSALLALCVGIHRSPVNSPHKGQWRGALMFSLNCTWTNGWVNTRDAGDLRRHRVNYDVTVMMSRLVMQSDTISGSGSWYGNCANTEVGFTESAFVNVSTLCCSDICIWLTGSNSILEHNILRLLIYFEVLVVHVC